MTARGTRDRGGARAARCAVSAMGRRRRRAALLLEVIIALAILAAATGILGAQLVSGLRMVSNIDADTRAGELADRMLALLELDMTLTERVRTEQTFDGDFGAAYAGYFWRVYIEPTEIPGLGQVRLEVLHTPQRGATIADARVVRSLYMLKAEPRGINLETDFGMEPEQVEQFSSVIPIPGFDPANFNPQALVSLPPETLLSLLPQLLPLLSQFMGGAPLPPELANLSPDALGALLGGDLSQLGGGQGGLLENLPPELQNLPPEQLQMLQQLLGGGGGLPAAPSGGGGRGGNGGRGGSGGGR